VFTGEGSVRSAMLAVWGLTGLQKHTLFGYSQNTTAPSEYIGNHLGTVADAPGA
jgi:hypothetical protein